MILKVESSLGFIAKVAGHAGTQDLLEKKHFAPHIQTDIYLVQ